MKCSTPDGASVAPTPEMSQPVDATGQTLTSATDASVTVEAGVYAVTAGIGYFVAGWATTETAANIVFVCPAGATIIIVVPNGVIHFHYKVVGTGATAYLRKVVE